MKRLQGTFAVRVRHFERQMIREALKETKGNKVRAARLLGMNRNTLISKMGALNDREASDASAGDRDRDAEDPALAFAVLERPYPQSRLVQACWNREAIAEAMQDPRLIALILDYDRAYRMASEGTVRRDTRRRAVQKAVALIQLARLQDDHLSPDPSPDSCPTAPYSDTIPTDTAGVGRVQANPPHAMPGPNSRLLSPAMRAKVEYAS